MDYSTQREVREVLSFAMLETALDPSTATSKKLGMLRNKEIHHFDDGVWSDVDKPIDESLVVGDDSDDDMNSVIVLIVISPTKLWWVGGREEECDKWGPCLCDYLIATRTNLLVLACPTYTLGAARIAANA